MGKEIELVCSTGQRNGKDTLGVLRFNCLCPGSCKLMIKLVLSTQVDSFFFFLYEVIYTCLILN